MLDADGLPIIIAINTAGDGFYQLERERVSANFISSVHGKDGFSGGIENDFISNNANNNTFLFIDKEKSQNLFRVLGVQFPVRLNDFGFDNIIRQSRNVVNSKYTQNSKNDADTGEFSVGGVETDSEGIMKLDDANIDKTKEKMTWLEANDLLEKQQGLSYRFYASDDPMSRAGYAMFADDHEQNGDAYGGDKPRAFSVREDDLVPVWELSEKIAEARHETDEYTPWILEDYAELSDEDFADMFNPSDIVDSAYAWDNEELTEWFYNHVAEPNKIGGVKTSDGAIVFDKDLIRRNIPAEIVYTQASSNEEFLAKYGDDTEADPDIRFSVGGIKAKTADVGRLADENITVGDLQAIRDIGRKSVNAFTSDDVRATEKWARKFYRELGTKSPFFRAWFGDWRAADGGKINTVVASESSGKNPRGIFKNKDTGWDITSSSVGYDETVSHSGKDKRSLAAMRTIDKLLENAVLLDTEISAYGRGKKSVYTAFMHKFYALIYIDGAPNIAKIAVDESYMPGQSDTNKKFYHVRAIQIEAVPSVGIGNSHTPIMEKTASTISISDLYALVKRYDKDFKPKAANPALLNEDGTPKVVYHGTNSEAFTVFDSDKSGRVKKNVLGDGYYFAAEKESATHYGEHVMPVYLDMKNPYKVYAREGGMRAQMAEDFNMDANAISRGDIQSILQANGYDGVLLYSSKYAADGDFSTAVVFDNTQIKSATDNVGTFDRENPDIRFSVGGEQTDADAEVSDADKRFAPVESAIRMLKGGADLWRTLRETGTQPNQIALRMATSGESDTAIRELTGLYRDALGVWTYDKAWFDAHIPDIADTRELRAGYRLGAVDEQKF